MSVEGVAEGINGAKSPDYSLVPTGPTEPMTEPYEHNSPNNTETHTLEHFDLLHLSVQQQNAIDLLITGCSDRETADKVGVTRSTVTRWRLYHPAFRAELNVQRTAIWGQAREKLLALIPEAVDIIASSIRDPTNPDRAKLALDLMRSVKMSDGLISNDIRTDPAKIMREDAYTPPYASLDQASDYQVIGHMNRLQARLNGLLDHEYDEAMGEANEQEDARERAARKAAREAKKRARTAVLDQDRGRYLIDVNP